MKFEGKWGTLDGQSEHCRCEAISGLAQSCIMGSE